MKPLTHKDLARFDALDTKLESVGLEKDEPTEHQRLAVCIARAVKASPRLVLDDRWTQLVRNGVWGTCVDCPRRDGRAYPEECENVARYDHKITAAPKEST